MYQDISAYFVFPKGREPEAKGAQLVDFWELEGERNNYNELLMYMK